MNIQDLAINIINEYNKAHGPDGRYISGSRSSGMALIDQSGNARKATVEIIDPKDLGDIIEDQWGGAVFYDNWAVYSEQRRPPIIKAVKTGDGKTHALVAYKKDSQMISVEHLEASPANRLNKNGDGLKGSGSLALASVCAEVGPKQSIILDSTKESRGFYEKIGMITGKDKSIHLFTYDQAQAFAKKMGVIK